MTAELQTHDERSASTGQDRQAPPWARWSGPAVVAAVLAAGQLLWFTVELLRGYFWQDDFVFLYLADTRSLGQLLLYDYNGHLQPGAFVLSWFVARFAPLSWPAAALPMVAMQAAALWLCWRFLVRLYGERWALLVPFAVVAFSPLTFVLSQWWAYGLQLLPIQLALFGALNAHAAYLARPTWWRAGHAALFVVGGMAFAEKAVLIPAVLFGLTLALADGGLRARIVGTLRDHGRLWLGYLVLLAGYVALHTWRAPLADSTAPAPRDLISLVRAMVGEGLLPALYGGPWNGNWLGFAGLAPPPAAVLAVTWSLSAVVVLLGLWLGRTRAALAWVTLGGYLAASVLLVAAARLGPFGAIIGTDPRYVADSLPVAVVCAAVALLPPRHRLAAAPPAEPPGWLRPASVLVPLVLVVAMIVGAGASIPGALPEVRHASAKDYVENARAAGRLEPNLVLYDSHVPNDIMLVFFGDDALASRALRGLGLRFDRPTGDLRMLDGTGTPRRIGLVGTVGNAPIPVEACGFPVGQRITRIPFAERVEGSHVVVQFGYYTQHAVNGTVSTPTREYQVRFESGLHALSVVADGPFTELLLQAEGPVCVTNALAGLPLPQAG